MSDEGGMIRPFRGRRRILSELRPASLGGRLVDTIRDERAKGKIHEPGLLVRGTLKPLRDVAERLRKKKD